MLKKTVKRSLNDEEAPSLYQVVWFRIKVKSLFLKHSCADITEICAWCLLTHLSSVCQKGCSVSFWIISLFVISIFEFSRSYVLLNVTDSDFRELLPHIVLSVILLMLSQLPCLISQLTASMFYWLRFSTGASSLVWDMCMHVCEQMQMHEWMSVRSPACVWKRLLPVSPLVRVKRYISFICWGGLQCSGGYNPFSVLKTHLTSSNLRPVAKTRTLNLWASLCLWELTNNQPPPPPPRRPP